jgi:2,4-dienoyl-CoA reductase-like NADH-dependent reductase (Old Yellow Enzyme family)
MFEPWRWYGNTGQKQIDTRGKSGGLWPYDRLWGKTSMVFKHRKELAMITARFKKIFEPTNIGKMRVKNRIVMPPMGTNYAEAGGAVSQRMLDYYETRTRGGAGLIIVKGSAPSLKCTYSLEGSPSYQASLGDDKFIPGWRKMTAAVHKYGAKIAIQIIHATLASTLSLRFSPQLLTSAKTITVAQSRIGQDS